MKKILISIIVILLFFVVGCNKQENTESDEVEEETKESEETITIDVWDVNPIYEFDDIDLEFQTINASTENNGYYFNVKSPYDYTEEGGIIVCLNEHFGFMNGIGEIKTPTIQKSFIRFFNTFGMDYEKSGLNVKTIKSSGFIYLDSCVDLMPDYTRHFGDGACGIGASLSPSIYAKQDGKIYYTFGRDLDPNEYEYNLYEKFTNLGIIQPNDYWFILLKNSINEYVMFKGDDNYTITIPNNYSVKGFSNDIIYLVECIKKTSSSFMTYAPYPVNSVESQRYNPKSNYINHTYMKVNGEIVASNYEDGYGFYEEYASVKKGNKWGYIDKQGNVVVDFVFDKATPISNGKAWVIYNGRTGRLNIKEMIENNIPFNDDVLSIDDYDTLPKIEVIADSIKIRGDSSTSSKQVAKVIKGQAFLYTEKKVDDTYTWYKIGSNMWIADKNGEWIKEAN